MAVLNFMNDNERRRWLLLVRIEMNECRRWWLNFDIDLLATSPVLCHSHNP